jgi:hypothetical protein
MAQTIQLLAALPVLLAMSFVCVLLWGIALVMAVRGRPPHDAVVVQGVVIRFTSHRSRRHHGTSTMYSPVYRVVLPSGETLESSASSAMSKSWQSPPVGTQVALYYAPRQGESPLSPTGLERYLISIILFLVGGLVGFIGVTVSMSIAFGH